MKLTADEIFNSLKNEFHFESATGRITFNLRDYSIVVEQNNVVGNILEEWLAKWFNSNGYENIHNLKQDAPDFWLNPDNLESEWLEIKSFTGSPNFDIANFRSYINEIIEKPYKLHSKYLLIKYKAEKGIQLLHYLQQLASEPLQNLQQFSNKKTRTEESNQPVGFSDRLKNW